MPEASEESCSDDDIDVIGVGEEQPPFFQVTFTFQATYIEGLDNTSSYSPQANMAGSGTAQAGALLTPPPPQEDDY